MISEIRPNILMRLPSGNVVRTLQEGEGEWICEYTDRARARGEVVFSSCFLTFFGVEVAD